MTSPQEETHAILFQVGQTINGYAGGYFRDCYSDRHVEASGYDWYLLRCESHGPELLLHDDALRMLKQNIDLDPPEGDP